MMSPASLAHSTYFQHHTLHDKGAASGEHGETLPELEYIQRRNYSWTTGKISLEELCEEEPTHDILIVFLPAEAVIIGVGAYERLSKRFSIAGSFWTDLALEASGFFGFQEERDGNGMITGYSSQFRFLVKEPKEKLPAFPNIGIPYHWHRLGFSTYSKPSNCAILCFDLPKSLKDSLMASVPASDNRLHLDDPFSFHSILLGEIVKLYDSVLWEWRHLIRDMEKNRTLEETPQPDYVLMHEMARHIIQSSEMLAMAIETLKSIMQEHETFLTGSSTTAVKYGQHRQTGKDLQCISTLFKCLHLRSRALEERLRNEINWAFNVVAQYDSRIAVRIADATQVDSSSMKTLATLGLVFLPGTFICAIFSTTFFNFTPGSDTMPQSWTVSEKFWVYWVVAVPVTVATILFWSVWQRWQARRSILKRPAP